MSSKSAETVRVVVRCRPMNQQEVDGSYERVVNMDTKRGVVELKNSKESNEAMRNFTYDAVYDWNSTQRELYDETFRSLVDAVLSGYNGTIIAYGQTGTGKTFTMEGVRNNPELQGVIPNSFQHIFEHIARSQHQQYLVRASYLEIYQEEIRDLLQKDQSKRLELKERPDTGVYVKDLSSFVTKNIQEIEHVMSVGNQNRSVGSTNMNEHSSRSHAIFIITVECSEPGNDKQQHIRVGKLNLVDLAGSERQAKTGATGQRFKEATKINLSLSALGNVISALVDGKSTHIPYRDSKLTRLLQDSLGGNAKTVMVANVGPASYNHDETLSTLRYASRAKQIKNKPRINEDPKDALLREFQEEIARLKAALATKGGGGMKKRSRSRAKLAADGTTVEEGDDDAASDAGSEECQDYDMQRRKLEADKAAVMKNSQLVAEEKQKALQEIAAREAQIISAQQGQKTLLAKIQAMESKLLSGADEHDDLTQETDAQQAKLEEKRRQLASQRNREREVLQALEDQEESAADLQQTYDSLQQEVQLKTKKLRKLFGKLQQIRAEMRDLQTEHSRDRRELEDSIAQLMRELKLKSLIIDSFVPNDYKQSIVERAHYDDDEDSWKLEPLSKTANSDAAAALARPVAVPGSRRPQTEYARIIAQTSTGSFRFRGENILVMDLEMSARTTRDYEGPTVSPGLQAALNDALREEDEQTHIEVGLTAGNRAKPRKGSASLNARPSAAIGASKARTSNTQGAQEAPQYPRPRGLVKAK